MPKGDETKKLAFDLWTEKTPPDQIEKQCCAKGAESASVKQWLREWERGHQKEWNV
jgi:hypothetical protein